MKENYKIRLSDLKIGSGVVEYAYRNKGAGKTENRKKVMNRFRALIAIDVGYAVSFGLALSEGLSQLEKLI